jgi:hypothetical protein
MYLYLFWEKSLAAFLSHTDDFCAMAPSLAIGIYLEL